MNLNPIDFDYIDGTNIYPLQDFINDKINSNNIIVNSNINQYIINNGYSSNININNSNKISDVLYFNSNSNLYLKNNYGSGEIRFSTFINYPDNSNFDYGTKIDYFGKLHVYHNYNILQPTYSSGWYNVSDEILQLKADGINTDAQLTLLDAGLLFLTNENTNAVNKIIDLEAFQKVITNAYGQGETYEAFQSILFSGNSPVARAATRQAYDLIKFQSQQAYQNSLALGAVYGVGIGLGGAILGYVSGKLEQEKTSNVLYKNSNLTTAEKDDIFNSNIQSNVLNISNFNFQTSNLSTFQGFVNSNIINQQLVPKIRSNEITLNNKTITKFSLESLDNWIKTTYGWYWDATNGNLGINGTPNVSDFLIVGGQTTIQGDLIGETKLKISNTNIGLPLPLTNGSTGDKLILRTGGTGVFPYSLGINTNNMWYSVPSSASHSFYINGSPITTISSSGLSTIGTINASTNLQENAVNLSSKYLQLSGGTMSGDLSFNNRVQDFLIYLFSNNYGFGINTLALRYNVPFDASHKFYSGSTNTATISSSGTITATGFSGSGASLTSIPFSAITSVPSFVLKAGDTMTGTLNGTTINASTNLQENAVNLSSKYLQLSGGAMTGQITGITTLNASTILSSTLSTANNTNVGAPSIGITGGTGDKIILKNGTASIYPYSLGINTNNMWYSAPSSATHTFYNNGSPITTISSSGLSTTGTINASTNLQENAVNLSAKYLKLDGTNTMSGGLNFNNLVQNKVISLYDASPANNFQFVGLGASDGLIFNNYASGDAFKFRVGATSTTSTEIMRLTGTGYLGIGTNNPLNILQIGAGGKLRIANDEAGYTYIGTNDAENNTTNTSILLQGKTGNYTGSPGTIFYFASVGNHSFWCNGTEKMRIFNNGNVGIATNNANNILQVGDGGKLRISNGVSDYTLIGTKDVDDNTNTRIVISGNTRVSPYTGNIEYVATSGAHIFYTSATTERMRISNDGKVGIGANNPSALLTLSSPTQISARIILSGQEYYRAGFTSGDGLALFCGVNRDQNKQLWIGNSANLVQNSAKAFVRISAENDGYIDCTNGDGTGSKAMIIGGSSITLNNNTTINGTTTQNGDINVNNGNIVLANEGKAVYTPTLVCGGNTLYYVVNWNGTTHSGWFYDLNQHFYSGHAYLTIAIHAMNVAGSYAYCWFGRALLSTYPNGTPPATNGGVISLIADYRNPASYSPNNNYISVAEVLDGAGHSALKISISNAVFGAQFKIKVYG